MPGYDNPEPNQRKVMPAHTDDTWLFAYGSLMWRPDFDYVERRPALLKGYHRALCIYSHIYRGTPACPGLVLGLDFGGACRGVAFRVAASRAADVVAKVDEREVIYDVYERRTVSLTLVDAPPDAACVRAYAYIADRSGPQYAGRLGMPEMIELILQGHGKMGSSVEYLANTVAHLDELGVTDRRLHELLAEVRRRQPGA